MAAAKIALNDQNIAVEFKKITTQKGNLFIKAHYKLDEKKRTTLFYLKPDQTRFFSPLEEKFFAQKKPFVIQLAAWLDATENWKKPNGEAVTVEDLNEEEIKAAVILLPEIIKDSAYGYAKPAPVPDPVPASVPVDAPVFKYPADSHAGKIERRNAKAKKPTVKPSDNEEVKTVKKGAAGKIVNLVTKSLADLKDFVVAAE